MGDFFITLGWITSGMVLGAIATALAFRKWLQRRSGGKKPIAGLAEKHFKPVKIDSLALSERQFPFRVRADLQLAIDKLFGSGTKIVHFSGIHKEYAHH